MTKRLTVADRPINLFFFGNSLHDLIECYNLEKPKWNLELALYAFHTINRLAFSKKQKLNENSMLFDSDPNSFKTIDDDTSKGFKRKILRKKILPPKYHKLNTNFFIKIIGQNDYTSVKEFLIRNGFLEVELRNGKETYKVSTNSTLGYAKGYRITKKYRFFASKPETYTLRDKKQINRAKRKLFIMEEKQNLELSKDVHQQQIRDMASFCVNESDYLTAINKYKEELEDQLNIEMSVDVIESITRLLKIEIPKTTRLIESINRGDVNELKDHYRTCATGRMYTPFTQLKKIIRKLVKLKTDEGELLDVSEVDIDSCQPALLYVILLDHYKKMVNHEKHIQKVSDDLTDYVNPYANITANEFEPELSVLDYPNIKEFLVDFDSELFRFKEILKRGLYEYLLETHNQKMINDHAYREVMENVDYYKDGREKKQYTFGLDCDRKKIKMAFIRYMFQQIPNFYYHVYKPDFDKNNVFGGYRSWYMIHKCLEVDLKLISKIIIGFKLRGPYVYKTERYKEPDRYKYFSAELRRRESKFMTETVLPALHKKGIKSITIHDCVVVDRNRAQETAQIMNDGLKHLNIPTKVSI